MAVQKKYKYEHGSVILHLSVTVAVTILVSSIIFLKKLIQIIRSTLFATKLIKHISKGNFG